MKISWLNRVSVLRLQRIVKSEQCCTACNILHLFHQGLGTLQLKEAVQERKTMCLDCSLVESACVDSVRDVSLPLPMIVKLGTGGYMNNSNSIWCWRIPVFPCSSSQGAEENILFLFVAGTPCKLTSCPMYFFTCSYFFKVICEVKKLSANKHQ